MRRESLVNLEESHSIGIPAQEDVVVARARGTHVWDVSGKRYTDLFSGIAVANVGHAHPEVVKAISKQARRYIHVSGTYHNDISPLLAAELCRIAPRGLERCFFANSGAEAVEGSVKFAKKLATVRGNSGMVLIALQGSFHGRLGLSLTLTGQHKYKEKLGNFASYPGVVHVPPPYHYRYGSGLSPDEFGRRSADTLSEILDSYLPGDVSAMIIEPILGEGGIIVPPDNYLPAVLRICKERGIAFIADEVQTGIGRTGKMFASEHWGLKPDIMALAKGLGGGLPLAAILATSEVSGSMDPGDHFSTFGGNPVCCAAGLAALGVMKRERLVLNSARRGSQIMKLLGEVATKRVQVGEVRGKGLMIGVELVTDSKKTPAKKQAAAVKAEMMKRGFLIGVGGIHKNVLRVQPPLLITANEIVSAAGALDASIAAAFL
ncbi:MAG: aspartate aminotransferase family protein [Thaumarchaeota archaeon]|nr:aspartate aminotransferase family protein [Nitrososphaerota archaeon]